MYNLDPFDDGTGDTVFRDVILLALSGFVAVVIMLLPHLNPPTQKDEAPPPGNLVIELHWSDSANADLDLWVEGPGDKPVGYSNKGNKIFNLLRDDLGTYGDISNVNYEVAYSRGLPAGEYTVNVHLYRAGRAPLPIQATVVASMKRTDRDSLKRLVATKIDMEYQGQETTAFRFTLDDNGQIVTGSIHDLQKPLRSAK